MKKEVWPFCTQILGSVLPRSNEKKHSEISSVLRSITHDFKSPSR